MVCRDRNRIALQSDFFGAAAMGIPNLLCLSGDHQTFGNQSDAKNVFDMDSIQLLDSLRRIRDDGQVIGGDAVEGKTEMFLGGVSSPFADPKPFRISRLAKKVAAGAEFIQTQCIFDIERFKSFMTEVRDRGLDQRAHLLAGVIPLKSLRMAKYMASNVAGVAIPESLLARIKGVPKPDRAKEGIRIAIEQVQALREIEGVHGIHLMAIEWEEKVPEIVRGAGLLPRPSSLP
jgi:methylenetetrahydrofolate reductase (NADPH)